MTAYEIAAKLPTIDVLRRRCQAVAVLDRIIDEGEPNYDFTTAWGDDEAASMRNGSGDEWNIVFTPEGAFIRVFAHESEMSPYGDDELALWPGLLDGLPAVFRTQVEEPAFNDLGQFVATAVLWRLAEDDRWNAGSGIDFPPSSGPIDIDPDGTGMLEILLDDIVDRYVDFAGHYYETEIDRAAVEHVVAHRPLTDAVVRTVNPEVSVAELSDDLTAIGYRPPAA